MHLKASEHFERKSCLRFEHGGWEEATLHELKGFLFGVQAAAEADFGAMDAVRMNDREFHLGGAVGANLRVVY